MKRREFVQMTALAAGGMLSGQVGSSPANATPNPESPVTSAGEEASSEARGKS